MSKKRKMKKQLLFGILFLCMISAGYGFVYGNRHINASEAKQEKKIAMPSKKANLSHGIGLEGVSNARELGGYKGAGGKRIKAGKLLRSGALYQATKKDIKKLQTTYHLSYIVDFRSATVRSGKMDPKMKGVTNVFDPVFGEDTAFLTFQQAAANALANGGVQPVGTKGQQLLTKVTNIGNVEQVLGADYSSLVTEEHSIKAYKKFFQILLKNEDGSVLFHCSAGKDRTGVAAILTLQALGVKEDTIKKDYYLTNTFLESELEDTKNQIREAGGSEDAANQATLSKGIANSWGDSIFTTIKAQYGSMDNYLKQVIGLKKKDMKKLRKLYLE